LHTKNLNMKRFRPYFSLLSPVKGRFFLAVAAGIVAAGASGFGLPFLVQKIFPVIFKGEEAKSAAAKAELQEIFSLVNLSTPENSTLIIFACLCLPVCGLKVLETIRLRTFSRLQQLSLQFHAKHSEGDLLSRVLTDTNLMQTVLVRVGSDLIVQPFTLFWAIGFLIYSSIVDDAAFVMLIAMLSIPICVFPIRYLGKKLVKRAKLVQAKLGDMTAIVSENLATQQEIRAYNLQDDQVETLRKETSIFVRAQLKVVKYSYLIGPSVEVLAALGIAGSIYIGTRYDLTLDTFIPLVLALYMCYEPIKKLGKVHGAIRTGEAALDRIEEVLHSKSEIDEPREATTLGNSKGEVEFHNVSFSYDEDVILNRINIEVPSGQSVALVGPSGAGKSSFVSLIPRFYDVQNGEVKIDGVDIKKLKKHELRSQIAIVSQMPLLFSGTIAENIIVGKKGASAEEVRRAAENAHAHEFISFLPNGYETRLGERGEGLSGGQKQRIAIARAFLKNAPILILDEATSALDTESESQIQQSLEELSKGRTTFIIAHRFSSIKHVDRILVFNNEGNGAQIVAEGAHEEVYQVCDLYRDLYDHQMTR